jgi:hypothetical protein
MVRKWAGTFGELYEAVKDLSICPRLNVVSLPTFLALHNQNTNDTRRYHLIAAYVQCGYQWPW